MSFRDWTTHLRNIQGDRPLWPTLLGMVFDQEFQRLVDVDEPYNGDVFKDRGEHVPVEGGTERCLVAALYHRCHNENAGCLTLDDERIWLLGYEWPNQANERGRRADLVGLRSDGSLVVFECKLTTNYDAPLIALIEGLDYLACLLRPQNFKKIEDGFTKWINDPGKVPDGFQDVQPNRDAQPSLVVLAPEDYFLGRYSRSQRGAGWSELISMKTPLSQRFRVQFACSDFQSTQAKSLAQGCAEQVDEAP